MRTIFLKTVKGRLCGLTMRTCRSGIGARVAARTAPQVRGNVLDRSAPQRGGPDQNFARLPCSTKRRM
jgi:hypothetical protein